VDAAETAEEVGARVEGVAAVDATETAEEVEADVRVEDVTDVDTDVKEKEPATGPEIPAETASDIHTEPVPDDMTEPRVGNVVETRPPEPEQAEQRPTPPPDNMKEAEQRPSQSTPPPDRRERTKQHLPDDPFHGIDDADIAVYSKQFDIPPPSNDVEAGALAEKIRAWIKDGRQEQAAKAEETIKEAGMSGEGAKEPPRIKTTEAEKSTDEEKGVTARQEREESRPDKDNKPKKKRGLFGLFRKRDKK